MESINLAKALRELRRAADLSQRELAERAGLPRSKVGRIESGEISNPTFATIERLVRAAGGRIAINVAPGPLQDSEVAQWLAPAERRGPDDVPHEDATDAAGRHYPAHLDVYATYPLLGSDGEVLRSGTRVDSYHLDRIWRDVVRADTAPASKVSISHSEVVAGQAWQWCAATEEGTEVAWLGAHVWPELGFPPWAKEKRQGVLCRVHVVQGWAKTGVAAHLVDVLRRWRAENEPMDVFSLDGAGTNSVNLRNLGFHFRPGAPHLLRLSLE